MEQKVLLRHLFEQGLMMINICLIMLSSVITEKKYDFSNAFNSGFETVIE